MAKFICKNCNYSFKAEEKPKTCPYCNKESIEKEKSASEIVDEVTNMLKE